MPNRPTRLFAYRGPHLEGISSEEVIGAVHRRQAPMMHASAGPSSDERLFCGSAAALPQGRRYPVQNRRGEARNTAPLVVRTSTEVAAAVSFRSFSPSGGGATTGVWVIRIARGSDVDRDAGDMRAAPESPTASL
jgi:hypothetical protein